MKSILRIALVFALGAFLLGGTSCKRSTSETAGPTPAGGTTSSAAPATTDAQPNPSVTIELVDPVRLEAGRALKPDNRVVEPVTVFKPNDTIYFVLVSNGKASGVKMRVMATDQRGASVFDSTRVVDLNGPSANEIHASKPGGWQVGRYQARLYIGDKSYRTWDFEVK
jgi:hypothetical protein